MREGVFLEGRLRIPLAQDSRESINLRVPQLESIWWLKKTRQNDLNKIGLVNEFLERKVKESKDTWK